MAERDRGCFWEGQQLLIPEREFPVTAFYTIERLIEYENGGRKVKGENGLRIILDGNDVEELGVDEKLAFELWPPRYGLGTEAAPNRNQEMEFNKVPAKVLTLLSLLMLPLVAHAGVYKWVDANGQTHFGDRPPSQSASSEVDVRAASAQADPSARARHEKMTRFLEEQQKARDEREAAQQQARQKEQKHADTCKALRARLKYMDSISTFYNLNAEGERVFVSEAENEAIRDRFRKKVSTTCGG